MLSALSIAGGGDRITGTFSANSGPIDLASGLPRTDEGVSAVSKIHAAHRTSVDVPFVEQLSLKSSSPIRRAQEVNVAMYGFSCRPIEREYVAVSSHEGLHSAAPACSCLVRPSFRLVRKRLSVISRFGHPNAPPGFSFLAGSF